MPEHANLRLLRDDDHDPVDPDIALMTDYLAGELSDEQADAVEDRLLTDAAFSKKVEPLITMWTSPVRFRASAPEVAHEARPNPVPNRSRQPASYALTPRRARFTRRNVGWTAAAALVLSLVAPTVQMGAYAAGASQAAVLGKLDTKAANAEVGAFVSTNQNESRTVTLPNGSRVKLRPQSRLTWRPRAHLPRSIVATLKGEAVFEVTEAERVVFLGTMEGTVILRPGSYAVRCELGCTALRVTVGPQGRAYLNGASRLAWARLDAGEHGEVRYPYDPVHTTGHQYPELAP